MGHCEALRRQHIFTGVAVIQWMPWHHLKFSLFLLTHGASELPRFWMYCEVTGVIIFWQRILVVQYPAGASHKAQCGGIRLTVSTKSV